MKTTLNIDDKIMIELKRETARQGKTTSELVETALRLLLRAPRKRADLPPLPTFHSGGMLVDMADRNALYDAMEGRYPREGRTCSTVVAATFTEFPALSGNVLHDVHTAIQMREHGISRICTCDTDFHRFPFRQVIDPLRA